MKLELGKMRPDYDCPEPVKEPKKKVKTYPTFYIHDIDLKDVDSKLAGKTITVPVTLRIKEINQRTIVKAGKETTKNDSMDIEVMCIDFGKKEKNSKTLQDAIEDGLSEA